MIATKYHAVILFLLLGVWASHATVAHCAEEEAAAQDEDDAAAQANNPLANMTAFNIQDYYIGDVSESDEDANQFWLRFAQPFALGKTNWLMRASLPVNTFPTPPDDDHETGLGDFNVFAAYLFDTGDPAVSFGIGPQLTMPTATKDELGSEKWSAGFANVLFNAKSRKFQYGYLLTWQASFAGDSDRSDATPVHFNRLPSFSSARGFTCVRRPSGLMTSKMIITAFHWAWASDRSSPEEKPCSISLSNPRCPFWITAPASPSGRSLRGSTCSLNINGLLKNAIRKGRTRRNPTKNRKGRDSTVTPHAALIGRMRQEQSDLDLEAFGRFLKALG